MKRIISILLLALPVWVVSANGSQEETPVDADGPVSVDFYVWSDGDDDYSRFFDAFNEQDMDIKINPKYVQPADYESKLTTLLAGGMKMDAFMQKRQVDMFPQFTNGYIEPLDDLIEKHGFDFSTMAAWESALKVNGQVLALPHRGGKYYTFYIDKPFQDKGLPTPGDLVERGEWTWERFKELSQQVSENDGKTYGSCLYTWGSAQVYPVVQKGIQFINADGEIDMDNSILEAVQMRKILEDGDDMTKLVDLKVTKTHYSQIFYTGMAPMLLIGEWFPGTVKTGFEKDLVTAFQPEDFRITRLPCDSPDYNTIGAPTFGHVSSNSKKKDAAFQVLAWMAGPEGAVVEAKIGFLPPVVNDEVKKVLSSVIQDEKSLDYFTEEVPSNPFFYNKYGSKIEQLISRFTEMYLVGEISDDEYLPSMRKELQTIVDTTY